MRILFLDDDEMRHEHILTEAVGHDFTAVRTAADAIKALSGSRFDLACLDHDLGGRTFVDSSEEETGHTVAKAIAALPPEARPLSIIVHSYNAAGAKTMLRTLHDAGLTRAVWSPFGGFRLPPAKASS